MTEDSLISYVLGKTFDSDNVLVIRGHSEKDLS